MWLASFVDFESAAMFVVLFGLPTGMVAVQYVCRGVTDGLDSRGIVLGVGFRFS